MVNPVAVLLAVRAQAPKQNSVSTAASPCQNQASSALNAGTLSNSRRFAYMNGVEWIVDAQGCSAESLRNLELLGALFQEIICDLDLRTIGSTHWHQFPGTGGITALCLLSESHLTCHTFPEYGSLCLNLFCCTPRREWSFRSRLATMFSAESVHVRAVRREYAPLNLEATSKLQESRR